MIQGYGLRSTCRWCLLGLHSLDCFHLDFEVYINFTLFTCDCTLIYTLIYCVCQHTDPGMAQIQRGLTLFESGRYTDFAWVGEIDLVESNLGRLEIKYHMYGLCKCI